MIRPLFAVFVFASLIVTHVAAETVRVTTGLPETQSQPYEAPRVSDGVLLPEHVLQNSATHFPDILESLARERAVRGDQIAAD